MLGTRSPSLHMPTFSSTLSSHRLFSSLQSSLFVAVRHFSFQFHAESLSFSLICSSFSSSSCRKPKSCSFSQLSHVSSRIWTLPNLLTLSRIACTPAICYFIYFANWKWAIPTMLFASFTDFVGFRAFSFRFLSTCF